eukprot:m.98012 g.98012  ORF g.98012 m.98012 type:complete len:57 (+) comp27029_c0_seq1:1272-1442(+)
MSTAWYMYVGLTFQQQDIYPGRESTNWTACDKSMNPIETSLVKIMHLGWISMSLAS